MKTDWDAYYRKPAAATRISRRITAGLLKKLIRRFADGPLETIVELGGGGSCFIGPIRAVFRPRRYCVIDRNQAGLDLLSQRYGPNPSVCCYKQDVLNLQLRLQADLVFSVGLVEHFSPADTRQAILAHFALLRPGGLAIVAFPTPTWLYRVSRRMAELLGMWRFPDERPLLPGEVAAVVDQQADLLYQRINWPILLTQMILVARRR